MRKVARIKDKENKKDSKKLSLENVTLDQLYTFLERGSIQNAPAEMVEYVETIDKIRGMITRIDIFGNRDAVVKEVMFVFDVPKMTAIRLYNETIEYFYHEVDVSKTAWRNLIADKMDKMINFAMQMVRDVNDASKVVKMLLDVANLRQVNVPDIEKISEDFFKEPYNILSFDAKQFDFGPADKDKLDEFIEIKLSSLTQREALRMKQEAMIVTPIQLLPEEVEDARKS